MRTEGGTSRCWFLAAGCRFFASPPGGVSFGALPAGRFPLTRNEQPAARDVPTAGLLSVHECPVELEVLFQFGVLVGNVDAGMHTVGDHPRREPSRSRFPDLAVEHQLNPVRTSEIKILADDRCEELASAHGTFENLGAGKLKPPDRKPVPAAGAAGGFGQRERQPGDPLPEERLDMAGGQFVADALPSFGIAGGEDAVETVCVWRKTVVTGSWSLAAGQSTRRRQRRNKKTMRHLVPK